MKKDLLPGLLEEAEKEEERKIHLITEYFKVYESSISTHHWTEGYVNARYWHGRKKREVSLARLDSRKNDYSEVESIVKRIGMRIELEGFEVGTIRIREQKKRRPEHYHSVKTFPKS